MPNERRRLVGRVIRAKMQKTVTVEVERRYRHPLYGKVVRSTKKYLVHDEIGCQPGDLVQIVESRPLSRRKRWVVETVLERATEADLAATEVEAALEASEAEALKPAVAAAPEAEAPAETAAEAQAAKGEAEAEVEAES